MHRSGRASCAKETLIVLEQGHYFSSGGRKVELNPALRSAVEGTHCHVRETIAPLGEGLGTGLKISVTRQTTLEALEQLSRAPGGRLGCLNFASAKNPGGGFLGGAQAQEESLARASGLYSCLLTQNDVFYSVNRGHRSSLYLDRAIFSPGVPFFRDDDGAFLDPYYTADVITCAAPNAGAVSFNEPEKVELIVPTLIRRAEFVLRVAVLEGIKRLVLGAWGCGVFRNDPTAVAGVFADLLKPQGIYHGHFDEVVFAVFDSSASGTTYQAFVHRFAQVT